jgi:hypothetical protein
MTEPSYLGSARTAYDAVAADYAEAVIPDGPLEKVQRAYLMARSPSEDLAA